jgi:hypothetical protein
MDGFVRSVADALGGLLAGVAGAAVAAVSGVIGALSSIVPGGMLPLVVILLIVLGLVVLFRR